MLFAKGALLGLAIAAPLGPIGALCITRTLDRGFAAGVAGGLGTALADATYAALAAFGFAVFSDVLGAIDRPLRLAGGAFMWWLGWRTLTASRTRTVAAVSSRDVLGTTAATFALTIANPMTVISFAAIFAGLGLADTSGVSGPVLMVLGVFFGSMLWWFMLAGGVAAARHRLPESFGVWVSRLSGALLIAFGLWAILSAVRQM